MPRVFGDSLLHISDVVALVENHIPPLETAPVEPKGDITVSGGGATWTIDPGVVTLAKLANIATDRLLGRDTAGAGVPEELTVGGGVEFTGAGGIQRSALSGDVTAAAGSASVTVDQARGLRETGGPTTLALGAVADGQYLVRSGATVIGGTPAASVTIRKNTGADVGTRPRLNLIEGANITLTIADDGVSNEVGITIASTGGSGSSDVSRVLSADSTVAASTSRYAVDDYEIGSGWACELAADAVLEVG